VGSPTSLGPPPGGTRRRESPVIGWVASGERHSRPLAWVAAPAAAGATPTTASAMRLSSPGTAGESSTSWGHPRRTRKNRELSPVFPAQAGVGLERETATEPEAAPGRCLSCPPPSAPRCPTSLPTKPGSRGPRRTVSARGGSLRTGQDGGPGVGCPQRRPLRGGHRRGPAHHRPPMRTRR
jgi:hypothetical protein